MRPCRVRRGRKMIQAKITKEFRQWVKRQKVTALYEEAMDHARVTFNSLGRAVPFSIELWLKDWRSELRSAI